MVSCKRCNYQWDPIKDVPRECPNCKSYKWNLPKEVTEEDSTEESDDS